MIRAGISLGYLEIPTEFLLEMATENSPGIRAKLSQTAFAGIPPGIAPLILPELLHGFL